MNKHLLILACMIIGLFFLAGCSNSSNSVSNTVKENASTSEITIKEAVLTHLADTANWNPTTYEIVNNLSGVTMTVKEGTLSENGLTIVFQNKSDKMWIYGEKFVLEKKINGKWYQVPIVINGNYGFDDIGYQVASGQDKEWEVDWKWLYGSLNTGEYRIVKDVSDFRKTGDYDTYFLTTEVIITK